MTKVVLRKNNKERREVRIKKKIFGTTDKPRLSVSRTNKYVYGQIIDDTKGKTIIGASLKDIKKLHNNSEKSKAAFEVGKMLAEKAASKKVKEVVFDRNGLRYHGRVKNFAEGARKGGLKF